MADEPAEPDRLPDDLNAIKPPEIPPSTESDEKTKVEEKVYSAKGLTATQRADKSFTELIQALNGHIDFHKNDCAQWELHAKFLQDKLLAEKDKEIALVADNTRLKEIVHSISLFSWLAYLATAIGAVLVGIAGNVSFGDEGAAAKSGVTWSGVALTLVGLLCATYAHLKSRRADRKIT